MRRLEAALELLPSGVVLADIGCDHGKLCFDALETRKATKVYACDISAPSLEKARKALKGLNAEFVCCDGLEKVPKGYTAVSVCGMGGESMLGILEGYDGDATLVLQPQSHAFDVRKTLTQNGFRLDEEIIAFERNRYYPVMRFVRGEGKLDELQLLFGLHAYEPTAELAKMAEKIKKEHSTYPENERSRRMIFAAERVLSNVK
ncbi:MAG: SAM-dependent methyltransferase [Clostridia bacterium]|nr:SAM-dependent methyltransferase [Clostridia bacterium]